MAPGSKVKRPARPARPVRGAGVQMVYDRLRQSIVDLELPPGSALDEVRLSQQFALSRTPVREALVRLVADGLVTTQPNRGTVVAPTGAVCPVCGQGYDPGVSICPKHDEPLVPPLVYAASRTAPVGETRKICPVCGAQFTGESQFCGTCGAALVPVN